MGDQQHTANLAAIDSGVVPLSPVDPSSSTPSIANHQTITNETPIDVKDSIEPTRPVSPTLRVTESISSPEQPKKEKSGLVLANWVPDEAVTECSSCKRTFSALLLRFKVRILKFSIRQRIGHIIVFFSRNDKLMFQMLQLQEITKQNKNVFENIASLSIMWTSILW